jgi:two-component system LytT family sensor kinase
MQNRLKSGITAFSIGVLVFVLGTWFWGDGFNRSIAEMILSFSIYQMYAFAIFFVNSEFFKFIGDYQRNENNLVKELAMGFAGSVLLTTLVLVILRFVVKVFFFGGNPETFLENSKPYFFFGISVTVIINLLFTLIYFYKEIAERKITASQFVAKTETARYESLKSQLDPHFLFNSLNVLTSLIGENPALAEKFSTKLSKVYRYVLEQKSKDLIPLQEELDFARTYMDLLKMRFEEAIVYEIPEVSSYEDLKIVPLSLQILLENAVKHNVISNDLPLKIKISEEKGNLIVQNSLNKKNSLEKSTKIGLNNITDRYALITKRNVIIREEGENFIVSLPLLTQKIKNMNTNAQKIQESKYLRAKQKVAAIKEFYSSLLSYIIIIPILYFIWHKYTPFTIQWFWFPMVGWGIGLIFHAFNAFGNPIFGIDWEERKIKEIMKEEEKNYWE